MLPRLSAVVPEEHPFVYPNVWAHEQMASTSRIILAPRGSQVDLLLKLVEILPEPLGLLFVLVLSRSDHHPVGRYQSPDPESRDRVKNFLHDFRDFLEQDGRHNLWIASTIDPAMLVWDRHNRIYAYGPLEEWKRIAIAENLKEVRPDTIRPPTPHAHHYHSEFDDEEDRLMAARAWIRTPLKGQDEE